MGSVRAHEKGGTAFIGKLFVHPGLRGRGIGSALLAAVEDWFPGRRYELFTSVLSEDNIRLYRNRGYRPFAEKQVKDGLRFIYLKK